MTPKDVKKLKKAKDDSVQRGHLLRCGYQKLNITVETATQTLQPAYYHQTKVCFLKLLFKTPAVKSRC